MFIFSNKRALLSSVQDSRFDSCVGSYVKYKWIVLLATACKSLALAHVALFVIKS